MSISATSDGGGVAERGFAREIAERPQAPRIPRKESSKRFHGGTRIGRARASNSSASRDFEQHLPARPSRREFTLFLRRRMVRVLPAMLKNRNPRCRHGSRSIG